MKNNFIKLFSGLLVTATLAVSTVAPVFADACTDICTCPNVSDEIKRASGCSGASDTDLRTTIVDILKNVILFLGVVAVIVIVIGGIMYITSIGDTGKIKRARDTILYATIGLIICALAFVIVNFVIGIINPADGGDGGDSGETSYILKNSIAFSDKKL